MKQHDFHIIRALQKNLQFWHLPKLESSHQPQLDSAVTRRSVFSTHSGTFCVRVNLLHRPRPRAPRVNVWESEIHNFPNETPSAWSFCHTLKALLQKLAFLSRSDLQHNQSSLQMCGENASPAAAAIVIVIVTLCERERERGKTPAAWMCGLVLITGSWTNERDRFAVGGTSLRWPPVGFLSEWERAGPDSEDFDVR